MNLKTSTGTIDPDSPRHDHQMDKQYQLSNQPQHIRYGRVAR
ncbi:hypothetical protein [Nocardia crassostreae]|nr:hypothetical protein [Nocardia crassostreae]